MPVATRIQTRQLRSWTSLLRLAYIRVILHEGSARGAAGSRAHTPCIMGIVPGVSSAAPTSNESIVGLRCLSSRVEVLVKAKRWYGLDAAKHLLHYCKILRRTADSRARRLTRRYDRVGGVRRLRGPRREPRRESCTQAQKPARRFTRSQNRTESSKWTARRSQHMRNDTITYG